MTTVMSDGKPELRQLSLVLGSLTWGDVMSMTVQLGVEFSTLLQIGQDNSEHSARLLAAMDNWLNNDSEASWEKLIIALRTIDKNMLADELSREYCTHTSSGEFGAFSIVL